MPSSSLLELAAQSGFNAVLILVLLYYGRLELKEMRKEMKEQRLAQDRNTKLVTLNLLQLTVLVPGVRGPLERLDKETDEAIRIVEADSDKS